MTKSTFFVYLVEFVEEILNEERYFCVVGFSVTNFLYTCLLKVL